MTEYSNHQQQRIRNQTTRIEHYTTALTAALNNNNPQTVTRLAKLIANNADRIANTTP